MRVTKNQELATAGDPIAENGKTNSKAADDGWDLKKCLKLFVS